MSSKIEYRFREINANVRFRFNFYIIAFFQIITFAINDNLFYKNIVFTTIAKEVEFRNAIFLTYNSINF